jgi:hypothetical protein
MAKDNHHKKKQKIIFEERSSDDEAQGQGTTRNYRDMRSRISRGESYIPPSPESRGKELFPGRRNNRGQSPSQAERRPWKLPQKIVYGTNDAKYKGPNERNRNPRGESNREELFPGRRRNDRNSSPPREERPWDLAKDSDHGRGPIRQRVMEDSSPSRPNRKELLPSKNTNKDPSPRQEDRRPWELPQNVVGVGAPFRQRMPMQEESSVQARLPDPSELEDLPLRQRQLLNLQQQGQLPSDLLPSPHHEDFATGIQIKGIASLQVPPGVHPERVPFLRHQGQETHQLPYQQNISPSSSWDVEWTPSPPKMSPAIGVVARNARDRTSGSGPARANGVKKGSGGDVEEIPLVDAPAPDKSKIVVASQYLFQHQIEGAGMMEERDVAGRLIGIQLIEGTRKSLRM